MFERCEVRALLSTIRWDNEGTASDDTDGFGAAFGSQAPLARSLAEQAIRNWAAVIQDFNYTDVGTPGNAPVANT